MIDSVTAVVYVVLGFPHRGAGGLKPSIRGEAPCGFGIQLLNMFGVNSGKVAVNVFLN